jgi:pilus assembly protein Flp/PilA
MLTTFEYIAGWVRARSGPEERGASLVEYALLLALIAIVCLVAVTSLGGNTSAKLNEVSDSISSN